MANTVARQIVEFIYEFDYFTARDEYISEAQAEAETADLLQTDPGVLVAYLDSFGIPAAAPIIERIDTLF